MVLGLMGCVGRWGKMSGKCAIKHSVGRLPEESVLVNLLFLVLLNEQVLWGMAEYPCSQCRRHCTMAKQGSPQQAKAQRGGTGRCQSFLEWLSVNKLLLN